MYNIFNIKGLNGYFLLNEAISLKWFFGIIIMCLGVYLISEPKNIKDNKNKSD